MKQWINLRTKRDKEVIFNLDSINSYDKKTHRKGFGDIDDAGGKWLFSRVVTDLLSIWNVLSPLLFCLDYREVWIGIYLCGEG